MRIPTPSGLRPSLLVLAAAVVLSACDTDGAAPPSTVPPAAVTGDPAYDALLADVGGIEGLADLLGGAPTARLEAVLAAHDIAFERVVVDAPADDASETARLAADGIADCPMYFRAEDRQKWIQLVGAGGSESHYIDAQGRPLSAYKRLPPVTDAARSTSCQTSIGNWATPPADYDGGHLIGSQLGGWGRRANIVPQHYNFNRGNWKRVEDQLALCGGLGSGAVEYYVTLAYPSGSTTVTPSRFTSNVSVSGSPWQNAYFTNAPGGGPDGTAQATSMRTWLQGRGCR